MLRPLVQAAGVVLVKITDWDRCGLKTRIEAAKKRLHHNVLAPARFEKANAAFGRSNKGHH